MKQNEPKLPLKEVDEPTQSLGDAEQPREDPAPPPDILIEN